MKKIVSLEQIEGLLKDATFPLLTVKAAHFDKPEEEHSVTAQFPPSNVNDYDELVGQLERAFPDKLAPYADSLYNRVQTPDDIPAALGMLALILKDKQVAS